MLRPLKLYYDRRTRIGNAGSPDLIFTKLLFTFYDNTISPEEAGIHIIFFSAALAALQQGAELS